MFSAWTLSKARTLFPQFRFSLLYRRNNHVTHTGVRESVEMRAKTIWFDDKQRFGTAVICAVQYCTNRETKGHPEFIA